MGHSVQKAKKHIIAIGRATREQSEAILAAYADKAHILFLDTAPFPDNEATIQPLRAPDRDHPVWIPYSDTHIDAIMKEVKDAHVSLVGSMSGENTTTRMNAMMGAAHMFKAYGAKSLSLHLPYAPFLRADKPSYTTVVEEDRERRRNDHRPIMADMFAKIMSTYADSIYLIDPHSEEAKSIIRNHFKDAAFFISSAQLKAAQIIRYIDRLRTHPDGQGGFALTKQSGKGFVKQEGGEEILRIRKVSLGAPDGANKPDDMAIAHRDAILEVLKEHIPDNIEGEPLVIDTYGIKKTRYGVGKNKSELAQGNVSDALCFIIDDMISSGGTQRTGAEVLKQDGSAAYCVALVTHAIFPPKKKESKEQYNKTIIEVTDGLEHFIQNHEGLDDLVLLDTVTRIYDRVYTKPEQKRSFIRVDSSGSLLLDGLRQDCESNVRLAPLVLDFCVERAKSPVYFQSQPQAAPAPRITGA